MKDIKEYRQENWDYLVETFLINNEHFERFIEENYELEGGKE
tara:strand:- start:508 stop:633 length:126 start_codon:yes stop_codon:yes gene_type:complete